MSVAEAIDVREILREHSSFDQEEIEQLEEAIAGEQASEVRREVDEWERSLKGSKLSERNRLALGITWYLLAQHGKADEHLSKLSGNGLGEYYHAQALLALERYDEAAGKFQQAADDGYDSVQCALCRAGAFRRKGDIEQAEKILRDTSRKGATRAEYSYQMGCILADRGDTFGAIEYLERAVDMNPHHTGALFRLAGLNDLLGNDDEAIKLYEQCLSKPPVYLGALMNLGLLYEDHENYNAAAFCFRRILEVRPNDGRARLYLRDIEASTDMYYDEDALRRQKELDQVMRIPIGDFELSARSRNCLEQAGIRTLGDLTYVTEQELLAGKNFGETSLQEIREIAEPRGLHIGQFASASQQAGGLAAMPGEDVPLEKRALLDRPVTELNLSVRARKCLTRLGITSISELVSKTPDELLSVRNFGVTSLNEIRSKLAEQDLKLRND